MTKIWNAVIVFSLALIAGSAIILRRGPMTSSITIQLIVFIVLGSLLLGLGVVMRIIQRHETGAPDIAMNPWPLAVLGIFACLAGLYWSKGRDDEWTRYTKLPVTKISEIDRQSPGTFVRVEGTASSRPALQGGDGSPLAWERVEFTHDEKKISHKNKETISDWVGVLPEILFLVGNEAGTKSSVPVAATRIDPEYCVVTRTSTRLDGDEADVRERILKVISPGFTGCVYQRGKTSYVTVWSLPQEAFVTLCGTIESSTGSAGRQISAFSISTLTGDQFELRGRNITAGTRAIAVIWWSIGIAILIACGLAYREYRR